MEKPILFSTPMVQAILEGRKTMTRRVIKPPCEVHQDGYEVYVTRPRQFPDEYCRFHPFECPYGKPGDTLWVRETWQLLPSGFDEIPPETNYIYKATNELSNECTRWRPSIFMPREAARIFLTVKSIRVGRLQDISKEDAKAEGIDIGIIDAEKYEKNAAYRMLADNLPVARFTDLWNSINAKRGYGWDINPWVWVVEFERK